MSDIVIYFLVGAVLAFPISLFFFFYFMNEYPRDIASQNATVIFMFSVLGWPITSAICLILSTCNILHTHLSKAFYAIYRRLNDE